MGMHDYVTGHLLWLSTIAYIINESRFGTCDPISCKYVDKCVLLVPDP